jgi:hypothetical protein
MRDWLKTNPATLFLAQGELVSFVIRRGECRISCVAGRLWLTSTGLREDFALSPGEEVTLTGRGRVVVEALRTATVRLEIRAASRDDARDTLPLDGVPARLYS